MTDTQEPRILRLLDGCSGLNGASSAAIASGRWDTFGIDNDPRLPADLHADILDLTADDIRDASGWARPDVIWASVPCEGFSVASIGKHWTKGPDGNPSTPKSETGWRALKILRHVQGLISDLAPTFHAIENPIGVLHQVVNEPYVFVWQCHYGNRLAAKPTTLAGHLPDSFVPRPVCHKADPRSHGGRIPDDCCCRDHPAAPRGSKAGTQGIGRKADDRGIMIPAASWRAVIPTELAQDFTDAAERDLYRMLRAGQVA